VKKWNIAVLTVAAVSLLAGCSTSATSAKTSSSVTLTFLQNKPEVVNEWNKLISEFEKENPGITIIQIQPPAIDTTLQADVTKNQLPDIVSMGGDTTFNELAKQGIFKDWTGASELKQISSTYVKMMEKKIGKSSPYGIPYTLNAFPVIYNIALFHKYHLKVPMTFDQFVAEAKQVKAAVGTPFYNGW
jgi:raffinose/stachyose/melibiose transport system substrate-binding protein